MLVGGVANARPGSFADAFFFSVQTLGTIGYGHFEPEALGAHMLVLLESFVSLFMTAVATGIVFARFSQPRARLQFSETMVIGPMDGVPTLMLRVGNERTSAIIEALVRVVLIRTEHTDEGKLFYRMYADLEAGARAFFGPHALVDHHASDRQGQSALSGNARIGGAATKSRLSSVSSAPMTCRCSRCTRASRTTA